MAARIRYALVGVGVLVALLALPSGAQDTQGLAALPPPVDPQSWALPEWLTWDDYHPIPGVDWNERQAAKPIRAALILGDFTDRPFVVTQPTGSDVFAVGQDWADRVPGVEGPRANPVIGGVSDPGDFYNRLLITDPSEHNNFHTINEYWLEDSYGLVGVDGTAFGPYTLEGKEHEYGIQGNTSASEHCPQGDDCSRDFDTELIQASFADVNAGVIANQEDYDFRWLLHAGYDESGTWQEFGEMMFPAPEEVTDRFGPPAPTADEDAPNAAGTRYVDWTSWAAAEGIWSHAIPGVYSTQGENDGSSVFAHELSHIFGVLDNYNNPYGNPVRRSYSGPWDMLSRGAFNGPGGPHTRWQVPSTEGAAMGSHHMVRNKIRLGFLKPNELHTTDPATLAATGPLFVDLWPRAYPLAPITDDIGLHGLQVDIGRDRSPSCTVASNHACDGGGYDNYTVEYVEQIGHDSFTHDSGILLAKNKTGVDLAPFIWVIDSHPRDINELEGVGRFEGREIYDFIRPESGERARISLGDYRQLADALFHAGTGPGVVSEYVDEANRLHFYVLDKQQPDGQAVPTYRVAVRSLDGAGPFPRGVLVVPGGTATARPGRVAPVTFTVTNSGLGTDLIRLSHSTDQGWATSSQYEVIELAAGESRQVTVHVIIPAEGNTFAQAGQTARVQLTATSETDPSQSSSSSTTATASGQPAENPVQPPPPGGGQPEDVPPTPGESGTDDDGGTGDGGTDGEPGGSRSEVAVERTSGADRVATAVALSAQEFPAATDVVLARADDFPDALAGAPLAAALDGPMLLTPTSRLPEAVAAELDRLGAERVVVLGGESAISEDVVAALTDQGRSVERVAGATRSGTAAAITERLDARGAPVYLSSGEAFPDALSAAPLAAFLGRGVLLTGAEELPAETAAAIDALDPSEVIVIGGEAAVGPDVVAQLEASGRQVRRLAGANRYETSAEVAEAAITSGMAASRAWLATGTAFPDALSAGPIIARDGGTLLLIDGTDLQRSPATRAALLSRAERLEGIRLVGGRAAISQEVEDEVRAAVAAARDGG